MYVSFSSISLKHIRNLTHFHTETHLSRHTAADQHTPPYTNPDPGAYSADCRNERNWCGMSDFWVGCDVDTLQCLPVRPSEACLLSAASVRDSICCRESWESQLRSASCCCSSLPHSHTGCTWFIQRHGGWTPFTHREERKQRWDTGKKSSRDMQTRVSVWAQTALRWGYCGVAKDSPNEFTLLEFHSCQHLKEISSERRGDTLNLNRWAKTTRC